MADEEEGKARSGCDGGQARQAREYAAAFPSGAFRVAQSAFISAPARFSYIAATSAVASAEHRSGP